jgi:hypothetical protein
MFSRANCAICRFIATGNRAQFTSAQQEKSGTSLTPAATCLRPIGL